MELEIYTAFTKAGVPEDTAKAVVDSIKREIDDRYKLHSNQLATRGDVANVEKTMAEMEARLLRAMADMQRWTLTALFGGLAALALLVKLWP
ncbi:MAG: hypothetical protein Q4G71_12120 [Pseudomonadota bacterium]|nr:hypothetical protein [Pseudomonadota bacterium]